MRTIGSKSVRSVQGGRSQPGRWAWRLRRRQVMTGLALGLIVLLGAFLRFYQLGAYSIGNTYYAATVKSMLTSWHNFFYAAFEPGGSVTVDKPPLGFWIQAVSAYFLGVNGTALALPQAVAGVFSIPLLFALVRRHFGVQAGLAAALVLAVTPVVVSTERNNTIDGLLVLVLLLAAWAFLRAAESGRLGDLLLGAVLVGLGFNIKMLQALMPLPAFYALYFLGTRHRWWKRALHLLAATTVLAVVSLSWAVAVDLTPAEERPYIGSSSDNTVLELIAGHNGIRRLIGGGGRDDGAQVARDDGPINQNRPLPANPSGQPLPPLPPNSARPGAAPGQVRPPLPPGSTLPGDLGQRPALPQPGMGTLPGDTPQGSPPAPGGRLPDGRSQEVGQAGLGRLFSEPLVTEAGWLLPLALAGIVLAASQLGWRRPLGGKQLGLFLWAGWLLPALLYFSFTTGLFHAYYLVMLGPPLAALVGATAWALLHIGRNRPRLGWALLALLAGGTLLFHTLTLRSYPAFLPGVALTAGALLVLGLTILAWRLTRPWLRRAGQALVLLSTLVAPLLWAGLTTFNANPDVALPRAGPDSGGAAWSTLLTGPQRALLDYLLAHTEPDSYLLATLRATEAAPYILATDRPILTFGGFTGSDDVVDVEELAELVTGGQLRYVLDQGLAQQKPEIAAWVRTNCTAVSLPGVTDRGRAGERTPGTGQPAAGMVLYDCGSTAP